MLPACNTGAGINIGFPDVCLTPPIPVPVPYPNFGFNCLALKFSVTTKISMLPALNLGTIIASTSGDEPGVAHWTVMGPGAFVAGNPIVFIDKLPAINLTCPTTGNRANNAVGMVAVPCVVTTFYTHAGLAGLAGPDRFARSLDAPCLAQLGAAARGDTAGVRAAMGDDAVGVVAIGVLSDDVATRVYREVRRLSALGARSLVIDLRGCPGGTLDGFLALAADFLPRGAALAVIVDEDGDEVERSAPRDGPHTMPVVVWVDGQTASAAELFAACLQAHGRAVVVGSATYGKALAQRVVAAREGGARYATAARVKAAWGVEVEGVGVAPDVGFAP